MSVEYDFIAGYDLSSLSSVSQTQLMQAINLLAPLANKGLVILQPGTSLSATIAEGTGGSPDVTSNPRYAGYIWLNSYDPAVAPTPYYYDPFLGNWTAGSIAAGSISNSHINASAAIAVSKLATGTARYVVRTNAAGTAVEYIAPGSIFTANELAVNSLVAGGSDGYLKTAAGVVAWTDNATERAAIQNAISNLAVTKLAAGSNNTLLGTDSAGTVKFDTPANILATNSIGLALLASGGASASDILKYDGSNWVKATPALNLLQGATINSGVTVGAMGGAAVFTQAHGLGAVPKLIRVVCVCTTIDVGYAVGDELEIECVRVNASNFSSASVSADATNITVTLASAAGNEIPNKGTGVYAAMTEASWNLKVYAWR